MIEPWVTSLSRFVYSHFHHEPVHPEARDWSFSFGGPLSGAHVAIPWIVFFRDPGKFEREFPELLIEQILPFLRFRYLVSGAVGMPSLMPRVRHSAASGLHRR